MGTPGRAVRSGRLGFVGSAAALSLLAGCGGARPAPPTVTAAEVEAARQSIAAAPLPAAQARPADEDMAMLASVARRLAAATEPVCVAQLGRACGFVVTLDLSQSARAWAHGGEQVTVTAGMLRLAESEDELAAVVGHEFGHHLAGHLGRQRVRNTVAGTAASTVLGAVVPFGGLAALALGQGAAQLGAGAARIAFSKAEEREADYLGAYLVARAGYDLGRAGNLWARLSRPEAARSGGLAVLLATHPAEAERLAAWRRAVEEIRASTDLMPRRRGVGS